MKWNRFPDVLPEENKEVLVYVSTINTETGAIVLDSHRVGHWSMASGWNFMIFSGICVDFWCELPVSPVEDATYIGWNIFPDVVPEEDTGLLVCDYLLDEKIQIFIFDGMNVRSWSYRSGWTNVYKEGTAISLWRSIPDVEKPFKRNRYFTDTIIRKYMERARDE